MSKRVSATEGRFVVAARRDGKAVVRYEPRGKWFIEDGDQKIGPVSLLAAVGAAIEIINDGGTHYENHPGSKNFDRLVRLAVAPVEDADDDLGGDDDGLSDIEPEIEGPYGEDEVPGSEIVSQIPHGPSAESYPQLDEPTYQPIENADSRLDTDGNPRWNLIVASTGKSSLTFVHDGDLVTVDDADPRYARLVKAFADGEDYRQYMDVAAVVASIEGLSDLVTLQGDTLYFAGEPVNEPIASTIVRYKQEGRDTQALVKFFERATFADRPNTRNDLFRWIERYGLTIDEEGYFYAYKSVKDNYCSNYAHGTARVDGKLYRNQPIPHPVGSTVSMTKAAVNKSDWLACGAGLHVGSLAFARNNYGPRLLMLKIDPADIANVHSGDKIRVSRYYVAKEVTDVKGAMQEDLYEFAPAATFTPEDAIEALEAGQPIPKSWLKRLKERLRRKENA